MLQYKRSNDFHWFGKLAWIIIIAIAGTSAGALVSLLIK
jgi:hypothetical protein